MQIQNEPLCLTNILKTLDLGPKMPCVAILGIC